MIGPSNVADLPIIERLNYRNEFWWERAALDAFKRGRFFPILDKEGDLYLARFWLSPMIWRDGHFDSGDSLLLHWIRKADDDGALHDHPWDFTTRILNGAYVESSAQFAGCIAGEKVILGCPELHLRKIGDVIEHKADVPHRIDHVFGDCWTLVTTSPRKREWGFYDENGVWVDYKTYLGQRVNG